MTRAPLTGTVLLDYIGEHVAYELESIAAGLVVLGRCEIPSPEERCGVESFLVHARNLDDFFSRSDSTPGVRDTDVLAVDVAGWTPSAVLSIQERMAIDKMLAHLTTNRVALRGRGWPTGDIAKRVIGAALPWSELLPNGAARGRIRAALGEVATRLATAATRVSGVTSTSSMTVHVFTREDTQ